MARNVHASVCPSLSIRVRKLLEFAGKRMQRLRGGAEQHLAVLDTDDDHDTAATVCVAHAKARVNPFREVCNLRSRISRAFNFLYNHSHNFYRYIVCTLVTDQL